MSATNPNPQGGVRVEVRGLCKRFGDEEVLCGVDFRVEPGEIFVIMGPSGSGKSVLLKHLIGLETPDAGEVLIGGDSIQAPGVMDRHRLAMVFQSGALLNSLTIGENVGLYLAEHQLKMPEEIEAITAAKLDLVGLRGMQDRMPSELSGGMKKRASIARSLVMEPSLILYDEPTSELDPVSAVTIGREIVNLRRRIGATSIVVSHDRDLAFGIADRIAIIQRGRILCVGTAAEVRAMPDDALQEFLNANFKPV
jgi:phospholipid/cholesterol/gamma-HCH transport system ATP-binding protein